MYWILSEYHNRKLNVPFAQRGDTLERAVRNAKECGGNEYVLLSGIDGAKTAVEAAREYRRVYSGSLGLIEDSVVKAELPRTARGEVRLIILSGQE